MDGESYRIKNKKSKRNFSKKEDENALPDSSDVLQSARVRCFIRFSNEMDELILDNRLNFLFHISPIFWIVFFVCSRGK
jgi:hypothetical protein